MTTLIQCPGHSSSVAIDRGHNVSTANAGARNRWHVFVDFPNDAGRPFIVLVSASGVRPGPALPGLYHPLRLNPDALTWAVLAGALPQLTGLAGTLDPRGTARGLIDLSALGPAARGTPFWLVGLVLDPGPPLTVRRTSPPVVVQVR